MAEKNGIYKCEICGNIVSVIEAKDGELVCCGKPMVLLEEKGKQAYDKTTISIGGKVGGDFLAWADHTMLIVGEMKGEKLSRIVYTKPSQSRECKSRGNVIKNGWEWISNDEENFKQLRKQFD